MKSLISLFLTIIVLFELQGQTYRPFIQNDTVFYRFQRPITLANFGSTTTQNFIIAAYIDSQQTIGNSIYRYFYKTVQKDSDQNCFRKNQNHWFGNKYIEMDNGVFYFFNQHNDTITIKTQDTNSWISYKYSDNSYLEAKINSLSLMNVLNFSDSVKQIVFKRKDINGNIIPDSINQISLLLSKNYSFIKLFAFNSFPDSIQLLDITGIQSLQAGNVIPKIREIYDFAPGDTFLYEYVSISGNPPIYNPQPYYELRVIVDYHLHADSIHYSFIRKRYLWGNLVLNDTVMKVVKCIDSLVTSVENMRWLPMQEHNSGNYVYMYSMYDSDYNHHLTLKFPEIFLINSFDDTSCYWFDMPLKSLINNDSINLGQYVKYIKGLGVEINRKIFVDNGAPLLGCYPCEKLIYFNKNGEQWGTNILTRLSTNEIVKTTVFPNPSDNIFLIKSDKIIQNLHVYNLLYQIVYAQFNVHNNAKIIDLSNLPSGMYMLTVEYSNGNVSKHKIVKR